MASTVLLPYQTVTVTVPASSALATFSTQPYLLSNSPVFANYPPVQPSVFFGNSGANTTSAYTTTTNVIIQSGGAPLWYNVGVSAAVFDRPNFQPTVGTLNATGTLTAALIMGGIVTSSTAAAVTATLDTGTVMDAAAAFAVGDAFDWSAINTGGTNAFTVTAATGHTIVGTAAVAANTTGRFRTVKTAANTFVTYRIS